MKFSKDRMKNLGRVVLWNLVPVLLAGILVHAYHLKQQTDCRMKGQLEQKLNAEANFMAGFLAEHAEVDRLLAAYQDTLNGYFTSLSIEDELAASKQERQIENMVKQLSTSLATLESRLPQTQYRPVYELVIENYRVRLAELKHYWTAKANLIALEGVVQDCGACDQLIAQKNETIRTLDLQIRQMISRSGGCETQVLNLESKKEELSEALRTAIAEKEERAEQLREWQSAYQKLATHYQKDIQAVFDLLEDGIEKNGPFDCTSCCEGKVKKLSAQLKEKVPSLAPTIHVRLTNN